MSLRRTIAALFLALSATSLAAQERSLDWPSVTVTAHLDADGRLHVSEQQIMRFTGDWNGGERVFNLRNGQSVELLGMRRIDSLTRSEVAMEPGDLSEINHFDWTDSRTVRWRSRQASDPEFSNTRLGYVLDYVFSNILIPQDDGSYLLDHNFVFPDRDGRIEEFALTLTLDTAWHSTMTVPEVYLRSNLPPGESYTVTLPLTHSGATPPASVLRGASASFRYALAMVFGGGIVLLFATLITREFTLGRFAPMVAERDITPEWLDQHVFSRLPEVAGAAWDARTSAPEVAATLARLVQEGKLSSTVETTKRFLGTKNVLHLAIVGDRDQFTGHEKSLINALFTSKSKTTDTDRVRERYRSSGFDPAQLIRKRLEQLVEQTAPGAARKAPSRWPTVGMLVVGFAMTIGGIIKRPNDGASAIAILIGAIPAYLIAVGVAAAWRNRVHRFAILTMLGMVLVAALSYAMGVVFLWHGTMRISALVLGGTTLWYFGLIHSIANMAGSRQSAERIQLRKELTAARNYFRTQLAQQRPQLNDAWFPYLIAFGLGRHIDKWFRAFGGAGAAGSEGGLAMSPHTTGMSASSSATGGWTGFGGGGGFSGAGGGASFASAIGGMASSVPAPSSSSSSSGGGSSSSSSGSSGGGGGGGW